MEKVNIFWFRRDLRLHDNAALYHALREGLPVLPIFIFDKNILDDLEDRSDSRVTFIHRTITELQESLRDISSGLEVFHDVPADVFTGLMRKYRIQRVFANHDYEQYALDRDRQIKTLLGEKDIPFLTFKDQVIFEKNEVVKDDGSPYVVFTPYARKWRSLLTEFYLKPYPADKYFTFFAASRGTDIPSLASMGFTPGKHDIPPPEVSEKELHAYARDRDYPARDGTSRIGIHLRFGTVSIRALVKKAMAGSDIFLNELIWREFYQMILWHFPHVNRGEAFRKEYDNIPWRNDENEFRRWCEGSTGYPIVDAGMRQLNETGFMHNRVRMITASFLSKHLLVDWRWGESYFAQKLLDYEFASNNGGWQWAAGSGCDAAPYFRIFNPALQTKKFDPKLEYVRRWVLELDSFGYPLPVVDHEFARKRCLEVYSKAIKLK